MSNEALDISPKAGRILEAIPPENFKTAPKNITGELIIKLIKGISALFNKFSTTFDKSANAALN